MSTDFTFVEYIAELLSPLGYIRTKKMFGSYGIYCNEVFFALICDGIVFFQVNESFVSEFSELEAPFPGAKLWGKITPELLEDGEKLLHLARLSYFYKKNK